MQNRPAPSAPVDVIRAAATRVGHDAVWVFIAALFCIVEGAVKATELPPALARRLRQRATLRGSLAPSATRTRAAL